MNASTAFSSARLPDALVNHGFTRFSHLFRLFCISRIETAAKSAGESRAQAMSPMSTSAEAMTAGGAGPRSERERNVAADILHPQSRSRGRSMCVVAAGRSGHDVARGRTRGPVA